MQRFVIAVCCATLIAVLMDITMVHLHTVHADTVSVHIRRAEANHDTAVSYYGESVVGFSCVEDGNQPVCFVATK